MVGKLPTPLAAVSATSLNPHGHGGIFPLGTSPGGQPEVRRRIAINARMELTDDETFGNEPNSGDKSGEVAITSDSSRDHQWW